MFDKFNFIYGSIFLLLSNVIYAQNQDQETATPICEFGIYAFSNYGQFGKVHTIISTDEMLDAAFKETNSIWLKWESDSEGKLEFSIFPKEFYDDVDFILFQVNQKDGKTEIIRSSMAGSNHGMDNLSFVNCLGKTGISRYSDDLFETSGCDVHKDNFLKELDTKKGDEYYLLINNFESFQDIIFEIGGTCKLKNYNTCDADNMVEKLALIQLIPNPAKEIIAAEIFNTEPKIINYNILNVAGILMNKGMIETNVGKNQYPINISELASGSYYFELLEGNEKIIKQFVKI